MSDPGDVALRGRRALVTGANGFIGRHLVQALVQAGVRVTVLSRRSSAGALAAGKLITSVEADLTSAASMARLDAAVAGDVVFHLAAAGTRGPVSSSELFDVNVAGTLVVLELARRGGARRVVYAGSASEYGGGSRRSEQAPTAPQSPYGASKLAATLAAQAYGRTHRLETVGLRIFSLYGPGEDLRRLVAHTIHCAMAGEDIPLTPGEQQRDLVFVDDVVGAFLRAATHPGIGGEIFNVCAGREWSVRDVVATTLSLMGEPVKPLFGALPYQPGEPGCLSGDPAKSAARLGWEAVTPLDEGLRRTIAWSREQRAGLLAAGIRS